MNPALHISYDDLVLNQAAQRDMLDPTTGASTFTTGEKMALAIWFTNALKEAWDRPRGKDWVWPFTVTSATLTVTSGVIALADVSYGPWFSLWSEDPRPANSAAYRIPVRMHDASGIYPQCDITSVFGLYVPRAPELSSVAWIAATAYDAGTVRYDSTTGQCYRAKIAVTASPAVLLTNTTYWEEQLIPKNFNDYLSYYALAKYWTSKGNHGSADKCDQDALDDLEREYIAAFRDSPSGSGKPIYAGGAWR